MAYNDLLTPQAPFGQSAVQATDGTVLSGLQDPLQPPHTGVGSGARIPTSIEPLTAVTLHDTLTTNFLPQPDLILDTTITLSDNSLALAQNLDTLTGLKSRNGFVGSTDTVDYYSFEVTGIRDVTLTLTGLESNADLRLIQDKNNNGLVDAGEVIAWSSRSGSLNESINKVLASGTYFAEISQVGGGSNSYEFRSNANLPQVTVDVTRIKAIDNPDTGWFGDDADYYSKITIDGATYTTGTISNDNDVSPSNWKYTRTVSGNSRYVSISIEVLDSDGGLAGADDRIDIDSKSGYRDINLWYDLLTNQVTGDVNGTGGYTLMSTGAGDGDRAQAWFKVSEGDWYDRNLGDNDLTNITRNFAADGINRTDMVEIIRETKDYGSMTSTELADVRTVVNSLYMPEYVKNLASKVVNGDVANTRSGIGNLFAGSSDTQIESLVGKWFFGSDRPTASGTYQYTSGSLFQNGISIFDVDQGSTGDCYFLAALGAAAQDKPSVISNMFIDNGDGTFTIRFFKPDGSRDYVTVDRYLPTSGSSKVYAGWGGGAYNESDNELWVALLEKAYAQINESGWIGQDNTNSYAGIDGGWMDNVINQISGYSTTSKNATSMTQTELINLVNSSKMLTVGFVNGTIPGVVNNHAYTITAYNPFTGRFRLHNPWGTSHADVTFAELQSMKGWIQYSNI
ncbi:MAG: C2 family cysteine protease [Synechococcales bacterium]|nr:C2 family cysteine protease [Synechococcales bacterium]